MTKRRPPPPPRGVHSEPASNYKVGEADYSQQPDTPPRGTPVHIIYTTSAGEKRTSTGRYVLNSNGQWRAILTGAVWPVHLPITGWTKESDNA